MLLNSGPAVHLTPIHLSPSVHDSLVEADHLLLHPQVEILPEVLVTVADQKVFLVLADLQRTGLAFPIRSLVLGMARIVPGDVQHEASDLLIEALPLKIIIKMVAMIKMLKMFMKLLLHFSILAVTTLNVAKS